MKLLDVVRELRRHLEENGRVSLRMLRRQYELDDETLDELIEELVDVQRIARREENVLVWAGQENKGLGVGPTPNPSTPNPSSPNPHSETRKVITIIFADLMGSTALQERLDPESVNRVMDAYYQAVRGPVEAAGGTVVQLLGDGVLCAFGIPTIAEDDALRAVRAAVGIQQAFREFLGTQQWLSVPIGLRVAVNTGEVVVSDEHPAGIGDPLNVAARLQQEARDGEVLIGQTTRRLVADAVTLEQAGVFALKGRAETVTAYRVMSLERPTGAAAAAFVGRADELARITAVYESALATPAARLAVLVASPGLGKSRLIEEVASRLADSATLVTAHCDAVGGATFAPVAEALREWLASRSADPSDASDRQATLAAAVPEGTADRDRILAGITALLAGSPASPEETFFVIRRLLTALAQDRPVVLVIDDLHWAEPLLLDLVEHLIQWGSGVPLFVLIGARPELRDLRSSLVTPGGFVSDVLTLSGLDAGAAMRLAANVIGASDLPAAVAAKVLATSEGNPLFVSELVRMLVDEGAIERQGERWVVGANLAVLEMPPTIHALLAARIERLRPDERSVLERAAVVGRHFSRGAVSALLGRNGNELDALLEGLRRSELIERDAGWFLGEPVLRFHHVLIRDAAYRRLLKGTRAELHERLAEWIEARAGDVAEHDETIGWHLEQAHQLLRELGPIDAAGRSLGERAARHLADAGRRALGRDDLPVAADLLGRAINRLDADDAARADLALDWCEALLSAGDVGRASVAIEELARFAGAGAGDSGLGAGEEKKEISSSPASPQPLAPSPLSSNPQPLVTSPRAEGGRNGRLRAWHTCFTAQLTVLTAPQGLQTAADSVAAAAQQLAALGDAGGEAKAHSVHATALARLGKVGACEAALDQALAAARRGGDRRRANAVLAGAPLAALWGPSPVTRASGRCLDVVRVLRITQGAPAVESVALSCQGVLEALRGRTEAARRMLASSRKMVEDLGIAPRLFEADAFAGRIAAMEGDDVTAERLLRSAYEGLRDLGLGIDAARASALLGRTLLAQGRSAEAEALSHESEALAGDDLQAAIAWRGVRAEALAQRGEHAVAIELAKAAVAIASSTDALLDHADARVALATALRAAGRGVEADAEEHRAIELWEAKGATLLAERARREVNRIEAIAATSRQGRARVPRPAPTAGAPSARGPRTARPTPGRRLRANAAARNAARIAAALGAADLDAAARELGDSVHVVHHPTGLTYDRQALLESFHRTFQTTKGIAVRHEALATLGDSLCLSHQVGSIDSVEDETLSVGAAELETLMLEEVDATGRRSRIEVFAPDHLAEAIARLYQRHAEILPEGPERERAAATARMFGVWLMSPDDVDRVATVIAPDFESVDHRPLSTWSMRGGSAFLEHLRALGAVADDVVIPVQDVLALGPNALLTRRMHSGTERLGGGAYERPFLVLFAADADGRVARAEWFDADREAEALARFDVLVAGTEPKRPVRRRLRANAATALQDRFDAALAVRDFDGVRAVFDASHQEIDHPTGSTYGRDACIASLQRLFRSRQPHYETERLATLGELLLLVRRRSGASGAARGNYDVGAYENEAFQLFEANEAGLCCRAEVFSADHLGEAIARLYQRYAEILPDGEQRSRAAAVALLATVSMTAHAPDHVERLAALLAPDFEGIDHRHLSTWSTHGAAAYVEHLHALRQVGDNIVFRHDEILALAPAAFLNRVLHSGTERLGGGAYERHFLSLFATDAEGRFSRAEWFDEDREAEALARFEEIIGERGGPGTARPTQARRVRANAATRGTERFQAVIAARDGAALAEVFAESLDVLHHPTRATYGRREMLATWRSIVNAERLEFRSEILASLGDRLALERHFLSIEGLRESHLDGFGRSEFDEVALIETDDRGRWAHVEIFTADRLSDAVARLYQRHADLHPNGHDHERAVARARALAGALGPAPQLETWTGLIPDAFELVDHRVISMGSLRGGEAMRANFRAMFELEQITGIRVDDVLAANDGAILILGGNVGIVRASGGAFERIFLQIFVLGDDGHMARIEQFDAEQRAEALARFAEIAGGGAAETERELFANAASRTDAELFRCFNARDWDGVLACVAPVMVFDERRRMLRNTCDRDVWLEQFRFIYDVPKSRFTSRLRATRGERLALNLHRFEGEVVEGGGPLAVEDHFALHEVDGDGRIVGIVLFDLEDEVAAHAELDARFEAGEGAVHGRILEAFGAILRAGANRDWNTFAALHAPDYIVRDHRLLGLGTIVTDRESFARAQQALFELAPDVRYRSDHLRLVQRGVLLQFTRLGTRDGGAFENAFLSVMEVDEQRSFRSHDTYDVEQLDLALARFAEIAGRGEAEREPFANAASRTDAELFRCFNGRDWEGVLACVAPVMVFDERRRLVRNTCDRDVWLEQFRILFDVPKSHFNSSLRATRGERLALNLHRFEGEVAEGGGPLALEGHFALHEVDGDGRIVAIVLFDLEDEAAAHAELDARFEAGELAAHHGLEVWRRNRQALEARDWDAFAAGIAPDFTFRDHRLLGWGTTVRDVATFVRVMKSASDLAPNARYRDDHLRFSHRAQLSHTTLLGTREGGAFESPMLRVGELDELGRIRAFDTYDVEHFDSALARFAELGDREAEPAPDPFANSASRAEHTLMRCFKARDWSGVEACAAADLVFDDRQPLRRLTADRQEWRTLLRVLFDVPAARFETRLRATRGERLSLHANRFEGEVADGGGPLQLDDHLALYEVDDGGRIVAVVLFAESDEVAAHDELDRRFEAGEGVSTARIPSRFSAGITKRDWAALTALCSPELVEHDHRPVIGLEPTRGAETWVQNNLRVYIELAPDTVFRSFHVRAHERGWFVHFAWEGTREGGRYEISQLAVIEQDAGDRSRMLRIDVYDLAQLDLARARFAELDTPVAPTEPFANAASRACVRTVGLWLKRDWETFHQSFPACFHLSDRRRAVQLELGRDEFVAFLRMVGDMATTHLVTNLLATRGDRVALLRFRVEAAGADVGPSSLQYLSLFETDEQGAPTATVRWDDDQLDAAYAELDARFEAGEGANLALAALLRCNRAVEARDWGAFDAELAPDFALRDHRLLGWGTTAGDAATFVRVLQSAFDLAPDARYREDHVRLSARGALSQVILLGTREGGAFENPMLRVNEVDELGRTRRSDVYDVEDLDRAFARLAELEVAVTSSDRFANAATRLMDRGCATWAARDWRQTESLLAADFRNYDRTSMAQIESDREQWLASFRHIIELTASIVPRMIATRGDRLALHRVHWRCVGDDVGPSEIDWLVVFEADEAGELAAIVSVDPHDLDAAYAELEARWQAGEAAVHRRASSWLADYLRFFAARDWNAMTALFAAELVGENHRLVGWGTLHGPAAIVSTLQAQIELAPDTRERVDHVRTCADALLFQYAWHGTYAGGAFENLWTVLVELDANGRARRADVWEAEQLPQALARFAEIAAPVAATSPFENTASRAWRGVIAVWRTRDVQRFAALHPPALRYRDHRRLVQLDLDREGFLAFTRPLLEMRSTSATLDLIATRGERLALMRSTLEMADDSVGPSAIHSLLLTETDERGEIVAYDRYDIEDEQVAQAEIQSRWESGEGSQFRIVEWMRDHGALVLRHDWEGVAALYSPAMVGHDHRLVGWGTLRGRTEFLQTLRSMEALSPDAHLRGDHARACARGSMISSMWVGTRDGGAFESPFLVVSELDADGQVVRMDFYDPHHFEQALARFAELRPDPLRIPANGATRMWDRWHAALAAGDEVAVRAIYNPSFRFEDRRPLFRMTLDAEGIVANDLHMVEGGWRPLRTLLATAGDRLALQHIVWTTGEAGGTSEVDTLAIDEMDAEGRFLWTALFDQDDRVVAEAELFERYVAGGGDGMPRGLTEYFRGVNGGDLARARAGLCDDFVLEDRRHIGMGRLEGADAYISAVAVGFELTAERHVRPLYTAAVAAHGRVVMIRVAGTNTEGGAFESYLAALVLCRDERIASFEFFEPEELDAALARLAAWGEAAKPR